MNTSLSTDENRSEFFPDNFQLILDSIRDPLIIVNPDLRIIFANQTALSKFKLNSDNFQNKPCMEFFERGHSHEECPSRRVFEDGQSHYAEIISFNENELSPKVYHVVSSPVQDAAGKVIAAVEVMRDITEMKALQNAILKSKNIYQDLFENTSVTIYSTDIHGVILSINRKGEELLGYSSSDLIGKPISIILPEEEIAHSRSKAVTLLKGEALPPFETDLIARNGERKKVEVYLNPIRENGHIVGFQGIASDITFRKQLEEEYRSFARELESQVAELSFLNQLGDMLMDTRKLDTTLFMLLVAVTAKQGLGFNRAFLLLVNNELKQLEGKVAMGPSNPHEAGMIWSRLDGQSQTLLEILEFVRQKEFQEDVEVNRIIRGLKIPLSDKDHFLIKVLTKQQTINVIEGQSNPEDISGLDTVLGVKSFTAVPLVTSRCPVGILLVDNAITNKPIRDENLARLKVVSCYASVAIENSLLHQSLQEKVKMLNNLTEDLRKNRDRLVRAEKLSAVGEMSSSIAHEIRNPLVAIGGFTRYMLKKMTKDDQNREHLEIIAKEVDRLENILRGILDFVKVEEIHYTPTDINAIIYQIFQMLENELENASIDKKMELSDNLPQILIDPDRIRQVLINIYRNAIQAMPDSGTLTVRSFQKDDQVIVEVEDTGIGIANPDDPKIFEPFYTTKNTGLGLGLTISSQILKIHGGTISARKGKERGSVIVIELPINTNKMG